MKHHIEDVLHMGIDVWRQSSTLFLAISELKRWAIQMLLLAKISRCYEVQPLVYPSHINLTQTRVLLGLVVDQRTWDSMGSFII